VAGQSVVAGSLPGRQALLASQHSAAWVRAYLWRAAVGDFACGVVAGVIAVQARFVSQGSQPIEYLVFTCALPLLWAVSVAVAGGYDSRFIGVGSDEFRRIGNAAVCLTAAVAIFSYAFKLDIARGYVAVAMPSTAVLDLAMRYWLRKHLHRMRSAGQCLRRVVVVGHAPAVAELALMLSRHSYHGMSVVGACLAGSSRPPRIGGIPVFGGLDSITAAVDSFSADTVAVLSCPEMDSTRLRQLGWELETTSTDLCVASALLDVAGPRTTIRPVAGLPLLHVDQAELGGAKRLIKGAFDRAAASAMLLLMSPAFAAIAAAIRLTDHGPVFFKQTRVGKNGGTFRVWKFRTMVVDAEARKAQLAQQNESAGGMLFKIRRDPRITRVGGWLRRWSLDELPQLINVAIGEMSLVGPRPALPAEAEKYGFDMQRRQKVKPGITGLWQVSGRSDLPYDEAVRLDVRYVENWSVALDLQILWKTCSAVIRGSGAYLWTPARQHDGQSGYCDHRRGAYRGSPGPSRPTPWE
jgi:exopolysaccharide biosynthesis polyprenyl glycosylphosphotransferase